MQYADSCHTVTATQMAQPPIAQSYQPKCSPEPLRAVCLSEVTP